MRRHTGQRALYEAWSRSRSKPKRRGILELLRPQLEKLRQHAAEKAAARAKSPQPTSEPAPVVTLKPPKSARLPKPVTPVEKAEPSRSVPTQRWLKAKAVQLNAGRIEISVSYQIAIAIGLGLILLLLIAFKVGQIDQRARYGQTASTAPRSPQAGTETETPTRPGPFVSGTPAGRSGTAATGQGDHWIVLAYHERQADLEAAKLHFADNGIDTTVYAVETLRQYFIKNGFDTRLLPSGDGFLLVTSPTKLYDNPEKPGTDGFKVKERIKQIGAAYKDKAPAGLDSFAPNYFGDAYGMKIR
ncbi:MAG: hypothetical protein JW993_07845 [Sedimentisphaerales bacterium]|nr:hypothetical protein [Sedimentisphaerales bacterium]